MKLVTSLALLFIGIQLFATDRDSLQIAAQSGNPYSFSFLENDLDDDCDACGCSSNGGSMGFSSLLNSNFVGIRYFHQNYKSNEQIYNDSPWNAEKFNTLQLWARIPLAKRVQALVFVPYHNHNKETSDGKREISGIGDINVMGSVTVLQTTEQKKTSHNLKLGAGIKIPTGKYNEDNNGSVNPSFQLGTGSWDYQFLGEYVLRNKRWGLSNMLNYVLKTENNKHYRFGNQLNYSSTLFFMTTLGKLSFAPQLGISGENYQANQLWEQKQQDTSGNVLFSKIGFELGKDKLSLAVNALLPISQDLTGGKVEAKYRISVGLNYQL